MAEGVTTTGGFSLQALREGLHGPAATAMGADPHRARLLIGMAESVAEKGYVAVTIADVVRHAKVSRRTFYEHFRDKEECFLAAYEGAATLILDTIARAAAAAPPQERTAAALDAYLDGMVQEPALTRVFLVEILAAGPRALALRRRVHERFAEQQRALVEELRRARPELAELSPAMSLAAVAAVNELVLVALDEDAEVGVGDLRTTALELLRAVVVGRHAGRRSAGPRQRANAR